MTIYPNVKINLGLNVLGKRPDGYHELETLFYPYPDICDRIDILPGVGHTTDIEIIGGDWAPETDLSLRACRLLSETYGLPPLKLILHKTAPVGAGLGSGSADAAFVLCALNDMFRLGLPKEQLSQYAARLGSDCPFFVYNSPMIGEGRGEKLTPYPISLQGYRLEVSIPAGVHVSTREAYAGLVLRPASGRVPLREALNYPVEQWKEVLFNDFEPTVFAAHPQIADLKQSFYDRGAIYASMSGSGSAVFGVFRK